MGKVIGSYLIAGANPPEIKLGETYGQGYR